MEKQQPNRDASIGVAEVQPAKSRVVSGEKEWRLQEIVDQLEACDFECEGGNLTHNEAWQALKRYVARMDEIEER